MLLMHMRLRVSLGRHLVGAWYMKEREYLCEGGEGRQRTGHWKLHTVIYLAQAKFRCTMTEEWITTMIMISQDPGITPKGQRGQR